MAILNIIKISTKEVQDEVCLYNELNNIHGGFKKLKKKHKQEKVNKKASLEQ